MASKTWINYKGTLNDFVCRKFDVKSDFSIFSETQKYVFTDITNHSDVNLIINNTHFDNTNESHHFIIQHFRIPKLEKYCLSFVKVLQIAYNIGQARAVFEKENIYGVAFQKYYETHRLGQIDTYINI